MSGAVAFVFGLCALSFAAGCVLTAVMLRREHAPEPVAEPEVPAEEPQAEVRWPPEDYVIKPIHRNPVIGIPPALPESPEPSRPVLALVPPPEEGPEPEEVRRMHVVRDVPGPVLAEPPADAPEDAPGGASKQRGVVELRDAVEPGEVPEQPRAIEPPAHDDVVQADGAAHGNGAALGDGTTDNTGPVAAVPVPAGARVPGAVPPALGRCAPYAAQANAAADEPRPTGVTPEPPEPAQTVAADTVAPAAAAPGPVVVEVPAHPGPAVRSGVPAVVALPARPDPSAQQVRLPDPGEFRRRYLSSFEAARRKSNL